MLIKTINNRIRNGIINYLGLVFKKSLRKDSGKVTRLREVCLK